MTGAVTVSAFVGLLSLFAGVALGWYLRSGNDGCPACAEPEQGGQADGAMLKLSRKSLSGP
ncbi:hypothetical protein QLQ12_31295 [Actinoplanes sp. NEAU-A12]|uniref:FeoB-associated Cys-rich membrane protein n=1 Tax=Actinoplanes sandaracinus TaxID=3045177 RepID=A0ABT6WTS1_9ACTN|nr:hypothetical protein [Actinoplanes sandaracinus]MDI6103110.1 hypothetical protein [Actinoplanes sandaracinus]